MTTNRCAAKYPIVLVHGFGARDDFKGYFSQGGFEKVNIIAHSKGGPDAGYMISSLGMAENVASLVTFATPHRGSRTMDIVFGVVPDFMMRAGSRAADAFYRLKGDKSPLTDISPAVRYIAVRLCEGVCDGLTTPGSAKWGNFRGIFGTDEKAGISHNHAAGLHRFGSGKTDIAEIYLSVAEGLKKWGYNCKKDGFL